MHGDWPWTVRARTSRRFGRMALMTFGQLQTRVTTRPLRSALLVASLPVLLLLMAAVGMLLPYQASGLADDPVLAQDGLHGPETLDSGWGALTALGVAAVLLWLPMLLLVVLLGLALAGVLWSHPRSRAATWTAVLPLLSAGAATAAAASGPLNAAGRWLLSS